MPRPPQLADGRPKGRPNKVTTRARQIFADTWYKLTPEVEDWIRRTAEGEPVPMTKRDPLTGEPKQVLDHAGNPIMIRMGADPKGAAELMIKMAEYHVPKLARNIIEGTGPGGAISVKVLKYGSDE